MASYDPHGHVQPQHVQYTYAEAHYVEPGFIEDETGPEPEARVARLSRMASMAGAIGSLALVVGIGIWGVKLVIRDVSGVPVVRALEGPMRIQPENPGGTPADNQGLAVNNVAAVGTAAPPPDRLVLAPGPVPLSAEDAPMATLREQAAAGGEAARPGPDVAGRQGAVNAAVAELAGEGTPSAEPAVLTGGVPKPESAAIVQPEPLPAIDPADLVANRPSPDLLRAPGVQRSPRPRTRPARVVPASASAGTSLSDAINAAVETAAGIELTPEEVPDGTRLAQLGAYDSPEIARSEWDRLNGRFGDYMDGKQRVIQKASSGGRTFYRLRAAGFDDLSDARRFCSALVAERADCIPVVAR